MKIPQSLARSPKLAKNMSKRQIPSKISARHSKKAKLSPENEEEAELPLHRWRVVLTGDFVFKPKATLEKALRKKGISVTGSVSGKTTHLILGKSGTNEYGRPTGKGSRKYNEAVAKHLFIVSERDAWAVLGGNQTLASLQDKKAEAKVSATKSSPLFKKVVFAVQEAGEEKLSLIRLKKELSERFEIDFSSTRSKNNLKVALTKCVSEGMLEKYGASYKLPELELDAEDCIACEEENEAEAAAEQIKKLVPERGRWRGLYVLSVKKSKMGRAKCRGCGNVIVKGQKQIEVSDDSLFKMLVFPGDCHEGVSRGYVECGYPGFEVVSRNKFFVHDGDCKTAADERYEQEFHRNWQKIRPHVLRSFS